MKSMGWAVLAAALCVGVAFGGETKKAGKDAPMAGAGLTSIEIPVTGMMCRQCVAAVSGDFKSAAGVSEAKADMAKEVCLVTFDKSKTDIDKILAHFNAKKGERFTAAKPGEKPKGVEYTYDGKPESLSGDLAVKGKDAPGNVLCRIVARRNSEKGARVFNVIASGDIAKQIEEIRQKGVKAKLTGVVSEKGIEVTKVD